MRKVKTVWFSLLVMSFVVISCNNQKSKNNDKMTTITDKSLVASVSTSVDLKSQLDARRNAFNAKADEVVKTAYEAGVKTVFDSGVEKNAKQIGDKAPDFSLMNALGENIQLSDVLKNGPVVLTWYRGGWCPYCNLTLNALQNELPNFEAAGATLIALTPELPDQSMSTQEKNDLKFQILSDINSEVAQDYGILYQLTADVAKLYDAAFDLKAYNGDEGQELPLAATYIIEQDGTISYAFLDADYRNRAEPSDITKALQK